MDWRMMPSARLPVVKISPELTRSMFPPFPVENPLAPRVAVALSNPVKTACPPPAPMLCTTRPGARSPLVDMTPS
jgi:hypothetical protein